MSNKYFVPKGYKWVCRPYITTKNGKVVYASTYGKKAFCFLVPVDD